MARKLQPIGQQQFQVTFSDPGERAEYNLYFNKVSAPKISRTSESFNDGATGQTFEHLGFVKYENITLTKLFDPIADALFVKWLQDRITKGGENFTIVVTPVESTKDAPKISGAVTWNYIGCQLVSYSAPEIDRDGTGIATLEMEVNPESVEYR